MVNHSGHHGAPSQVMWVQSVDLCALVFISGVFLDLKYDPSGTPEPGFPLQNSEKCTFHFQGLKATFIVINNTNTQFTKGSRGVRFISIFNTD